MLYQRERVKAKTKNSRKQFYSKYFILILNQKFTGLQKNNTIYSFLNKLQNLSTFVDFKKIKFSY